MAKDTTMGKWLEGATLAKIEAKKKLELVKAGEVWECFQ